MSNDPSAPAQPSPVDLALAALTPEQRTAHEAAMKNYTPEEKTALLGAWGAIMKANDGNPAPPPPMRDTDAPRMCLRFDHVIPAGETARISSQPSMSSSQITNGQVDLRSSVPRDMPLAFDEIQLHNHHQPSQVIANMLLTDVEIGGASRLAEIGALPCDMFDRVLERNHAQEPLRLDLGITLPEHAVTMVVVNMGELPARFHATLVGRPTKV